MSAVRAAGTAAAGGELLAIAPKAASEAANTHFSCSQTNSKNVSSGFFQHTSSVSLTGWKATERALRNCDLSTAF